MLFWGELRMFCDIWEVFKVLLDVDDITNMFVYGRVRVCMGV